MSSNRLESQVPRWRRYVIFSLLWCAILFVSVMFREGGTFYQFLRECLLSLTGLMFGFYLVGRMVRR